MIITFVKVIQLIIHQYTVIPDMGIYNTRTNTRITMTQLQLLKNGYGAFGFYKRHCIHLQTFYYRF